MSSGPTVPTGSLPVHRFGAAGPIVVAVHGITANGLSFAQLAASVSGRLWAPDLAGRAEARDLSGPWGIGRHADDVITVLEAAAADQGSPVALTGHSMGAFIAATAAARRPDLVSRLVLIDGGLAFPQPEGASPDDVDAVIQAVIGPAMTRLSMTFTGPQGYLDFWAQHPALGALATADGAVGERVRTYLLHDLRRSGEAFASTCVLDAVRQDGAGVLTDGEAHGAPWRALAAGVPTTLVWASRGLLDEPQGLYDPARLAALDLPADLVVRHAASANHYTILFEADAVDQLVAALTD